VKLSTIIKECGSMKSLLQELREKRDQHVSNYHKYEVWAKVDRPDRKPTFDMFEVEAFNLLNAHAVVEEKIRKHFADKGWLSPSGHMYAQGANFTIYHVHRVTPFGEGE